MRPGQCLAGKPHWWFGAGEGAGCDMEQWLSLNSLERGEALEGLFTACSHPVPFQQSGPSPAAASGQVWLGTHSQTTAGGGEVTRGCRALG